LHLINNITFIHFSATYCWRLLFLFVTHTNSNILWYKLSNNDDYLFGAAVQTGPRLPQFRGSWITHNQTNTHTNIQSVGLFRTSDHSVAKAATHDKHNRRRNFNKNIPSVLWHLILQILVLSKIVNYRRRTWWQNIKPYL
jgi:hypothetical protein